MCGIAGVVGASKEDWFIVERMNQFQSHRGPDGFGVWQSRATGDRQVTLGHRRLSILDLSDAGAQPMKDHSGSFAITFNGEIYNYLEVRAHLRAAGVVFRSGTDTEVILEAYKQWGKDCLARLNGMFAFAIFDGVKNKLFCARDRYGEKPFLFYSSAEVFAFASEYKALLQHPKISLNIDEWRLLQAAHNPSTGLDADRQTVFNDVQQLLPGEAMELDLAILRPNIWRYWQINPAALREAADDQDVFREFRDLLIDSVRLRMRSDVRVGSCLSGGLDSSAIVCIVRDIIGDNGEYNTFTGRFVDTPADEWQFATQVIDATQVRSHVVEPTVDRFLDDVPEFIWYNELPVGSSSQFAQWCVFQLAKQHGVTVLLDGQGADETLGGYEQYFVQYVAALRESGDHERLRKELPLIRERYPLALTPPARALRDRVPFRFRHWLSNKRRIGTSLLYGLRSDLARRLVNGNGSERRPSFNALGDVLEQATFGGFLTTLLRYGDRNSMAHSREVRLPFCDHRIAEFVSQLPPQFLMGDVQTKRLLRESMRGILPEAIRVRWNKQGFRPPQGLWFHSDDFKQLVHDTFKSTSFVNSGTWLPRWWSTAIDRLEEGSGLEWTLWAPLIIELWRRHFLERLRSSRQGITSAPVQRCA